MLRRQAGVWVVLVTLMVLAVASQAHAVELSVGSWWDANYGGGYGTFETAWAYTGFNVWSTLGTTGSQVDSLMVELAAWSNTNTEGWFDLAADPSIFPGSGYHEIFSGPEGAGTTHSIVIPAFTTFDFYLSSPDGIWHTDKALDPAPDIYSHHAWVFQSTNATWKGSQGSSYDTAYLIAWEDQFQGHDEPDPSLKHWVQDINGKWYYDSGQTGVAAWYTDGNTPDNNDMVVAFWTADTNIGRPVPEPGSLSLLAMALCGAVAAGRKRFLR